METITQKNIEQALAQLEGDITKWQTINREGQTMMKNVKELASILVAYEKELTMLTGIDEEFASLFEMYSPGNIIDFQKIRETLERLNLVTGKMDEIKRLLDSLSPLPDDYYDKGRIVEQAICRMERCKKEITSDTINKTCLELDSILEEMNRLNAKFNSQSLHLTTKRQALEANVEVLKRFADRHGNSVAIEKAVEILKRNEADDPRSLEKLLDTHIATTREVMEKFEAERNQVEQLLNTVKGKQVETWSDRRNAFINELDELLDSDPATSSSFDIIQYRVRTRDLLQGKRNDIEQYIAQHKGNARRYATDINNLKVSDSSYSSFNALIKTIDEKEKERKKRVTLTTLKVVGIGIAIPFVVIFYIFKIIISMSDSSSKS